MNLIKNKTGGEKLLSIWWFFVLAIVGIGIISGVLIFYGKNFDTRGIEAEILTDKIFKCLIDENGFINPKVLEGINFDIFTECKLKKEMFSEKGKFFFKIKITGSGLKVFEIREGINSFEKDCEIQEADVSADFMPKCFLKKEVFKYFQQSKFQTGVIEILSASNNNGGRD